MSDKEEIQGPDSLTKKAKDLNIEGYPIEGLSIGGHETCIIFPSLSVAFDIGRCPLRAVSQDFLLISHAHMDHIGGLPMYVATRGLYRMKPPTIIVPTLVKEDVEKLFEVHRKMDHSELKHNLIGLDIGEEFYLRKDLKVKAFKTYHVIPSQGYILYSVRKKLKQEYLGLPSNEIKNLKLSGVEITYTLEEPVIAFTGDTMADFIVDDSNIDALRARILVMEFYITGTDHGLPLIRNSHILLMWIKWIGDEEHIGSITLDFPIDCTKSEFLGVLEQIRHGTLNTHCTFVNDSITVEHARDYGHTHLSEIIKHAGMLQNQAILLIHFSARYREEEIQQAIAALPPSLAGRTFALTEGF
ncbi:tRNase Z TRZ1 isoform X1 [Senna tora]|uniref:TRNase Z TRZ1 isoform X1 n=1 Tax=Senna tora TaxID=362788 RepID=A0A834T386_9FABA|nr:tRNase Z TRZ1 isoform X1 [Senna tora]